MVPRKTVQTNLQAISATQFTFSIACLPTQPLNHLVVFLLPNTVLPPGTAATVYVQLAPEKPFVLLGAIGDDKPSAIFRVRGLDPAAAAPLAPPMGDVDAMSDETTAPTAVVGDAGRNGGGVAAPTVVILGISIEPLNVVQAALATIPPVVSAAATLRPETFSLGGGGGAALVLAGSKPSALIVAQRIIKNAFNYLSSFAIKVQLPGQGMQDVIPLKSFQDWWVKFEKKVELNPGFLEKDELD